MRRKTYTRTVPRMDPFFYINEVFEKKTKELQNLYAVEAKERIMRDEKLTLASAKILRDIETQKNERSARKALRQKRVDISKSP